MLLSQSVSALLYLLVGMAVVYLFQVRRKQLGELKVEQFPGLDQEGFAELRILLKTAYERMLYMGVLFFPLAYVSCRGGDMVSKLFFPTLIFLLFLSNIPPRNKIMRLLERYGLSIKELRKQGIRL